MDRQMKKQLQRARNKMRRLEQRQIRRWNVERLPTFVECDGEWQTVRPEFRLAALTRQIEMLNVHKHNFPGPSNLEVSDGV